MSIGKFAYESHQKLLPGSDRRWHELRECERWGWETLADQIRRHRPNSLSVADITKHIQKFDASIPQDPDDAA